MIKKVVLAEESQKKGSELPTERNEKSKNTAVTVMLSSKIERKKSRSSWSRQSEQQSKNATSRETSARFVNKVDEVSQEVSIDQREQEL